VDSRCSGARAAAAFHSRGGGQRRDASHAVNEFPQARRDRGVRAYHNISELTARTNDDGWPSVFASGYKGSDLNEKDAILVLSVGGGSVERNVSRVW